METILILTTICLLLFMVLATFDGFYLHLFKYGLFNYEESRFEHKTHTIRAILFPLIIYSMFINETHPLLFWVGIGLVIIDLVVLGLDAYSEAESRAFMGGLPKWEYVIHLFTNALHFTAIVLVMALKIDFFSDHWVIMNYLPESSAKHLFMFVSVNIVPGAIILAALHALLLLNQPKALWNTYRTKIRCC